MSVQRVPKFEVDVVEKREHLSRQRSSYLLHVVGLPPAEQNLWEGNWRTGSIIIHLYELGE
jgi:hypothetical protein